MAKEEKFQQLAQEKKRQQAIVNTLRAEVAELREKEHIQCPICESDLLLSVLVSKTMTCDVCGTKIDLKFKNQFLRNQELIQKKKRAIESCEAAIRKTDAALHTLDAERKQVEMTRKEKNKSIGSAEVQGGGYFKVFCSIFALISKVFLIAALILVGFAIYRCLTEGNLDFRFVAMNFEGAAERLAEMKIKIQGIDLASKWQVIFTNGKELFLRTEKTFRYLLDAMH